MKYSNLETVLKEHDLQITEPRKIVFAVLNNSDRPINAKELQSQITLTDRATIYRTLATYEEVGIVQKIIINEEAVYELGDDFQEHHHHLICNYCDSVDTFTNKDIEKAINKVLKKTKYKAESHHVIIYGKCKSCEESND